MSNLKNSIYYFIQNNKNITNNKIEKLLYLADWFYTLKYDEKLFKEIVWESNNGPKLKRLNILLLDDNNINSNLKQEFLNSKTYILSLNNNLEIKLDSDIIDILEFVQNKSQNFDYDSLTTYVFGSYPFQAPYRNTILDLEELSREYKDSIDMTMDR